jgi:hypothetical protein
VRPDQEPLARECDVFARFLVRAPASPYVVQTYVRAHDALSALRSSSAAERALVAVATRSPALTRLADAYARARAPRSLLRRKLSLLLSILETTPPSSRVIDGAPSRGPAAGVLELALIGIGGVLAIVAGVLIVVPLKLAVRAFGDDRE